MYLVPLVLSFNDFLVHFSPSTSCVPRLGFVLLMIFRLLI